MAKKTKTIAKSAAVQSKIAVALGALGAACTDSNQAVATRTKTNKKLTTELKQLNRRRRVLAKRKLTAATKAKKVPGVETRKALRAADKDLVATRKALVKARAAKAGNSGELAGLKTAQRQSNAYWKAITQVDRVLNKPKKAKRAKRKAR